MPAGSRRSEPSRGSDIRGALGAAGRREGFHDAVLAEAHHHRRQDREDEHQVTRRGVDHRREGPGVYCVSLFAESETQRPLLFTGETQSRLWITFRRK